MDVIGISGWSSLNNHLYVNKEKEAVSVEEGVEEGVEEVKVGIFGCSHGDEEILSNVIIEMKKRKVTHVIANGDFANITGEEGLRNSLKKIHDLFSDPSDIENNKRKVYIMPGNWDHKFTIEPERANEVMKEYGQLIAEEYDGYGIMNIGGKSIRVAHFPQHPIPRRYLPKDCFLYFPFSSQAHFFGTMSKQKYDLKSVDLNVVGHSHIHTHFYDKESGVLTYSPGGLTGRKNPEEHKAFGVYEIRTGIVKTYSMEEDQSNKEIGSYFDNISKISNEEDVALKETFNIKDSKICGLDYKKVRELFDGGFLKGFDSGFLEKLATMDLN